MAYVQWQIEGEAEIRGLKGAMKEAAVADFFRNVAQEVPLGVLPILIVNGQRFPARAIAKDDQYLFELHAYEF